MLSGKQGWTRIYIFGIRSLKKVWIENIKIWHQIQFYKKAGLIYTVKTIWDIGIWALSEAIDIYRQRSKLNCLILAALFVLYSLWKCYSLENGWGFKPISLIFELRRRCESAEIERQIYELWNSTCCITLERRMDWQTFGYIHLIIQIILIYIILYLPRLVIDVTNSHKVKKTGKLYATCCKRLNRMVGFAKLGSEAIF